MTKLEIYLTIAIAILYVLGMSGATLAVWEKEDRTLLGKCIVVALWPLAGMFFIGYIIFIFLFNQDLFDKKTP